MYLWWGQKGEFCAGIDSYYEYLLKGYILLGEDHYLERFNVVSISNKCRKGKK